jgi:hypothetical protein
MLFRLLIIGKISFQGAGAAEILIYQNLSGVGSDLGHRIVHGRAATERPSASRLRAKQGTILGCTERIFTVEVAGDHGVNWNRPIMRFSIE